MLPGNDGPLTVPSASSQGTRPGDPARSCRPVPAEGLQGSVAGLVAAAVASSAQLTGATGQRRAGEPGAAAHRSAQASRMSRNRQNQRPDGALAG